MPKAPEWDLVDLEDGRGWEVWRNGHRGTDRVADLYGTIAVSPLGFAVRDRDEKTYGPFTTLDEAAYAIAAKEELGDPLLLGDPSSEGPIPADPPPVLAGAASVAETSQPEPVPVRVPEPVAPPEPGSITVGAGSLLEDRPSLVRALPAVLGVLLAAVGIVLFVLRRRRANERRIRNRLRAAIRR